MTMSTTLTILVPVFNEAETLPAFHRRLATVLDGLDLAADILYVDDGSTDASRAAIAALREQDARVGLLALSRNFGKEIAMAAGLDHAKGDAVVIIDADLQDPPELIPQLVAKWHEGYDVVYATRTDRDGESWLKKATAHAFYRVIHHAATFEIPRDTGDFRLLSRRAVEALRRLPEQHRFMKGLFTWIGFRQTGIPYHREPRHAGQTKWNYWRLWNFALEGITSFTTAPLRLATYLGFLIALLAFAYGLWIVLGTLLHGNPVAGYPSLMAVVLFLGGIQLLFIGILGEYIGRMFDESKRRPLYLIDAYQPSVLTRSEST
ncbi:MAG: glycosyltransferase family 2 protein [Halothiobacillaceae bacterium]|nr:MAG: glycosyltransferase family 2 protein [Halothiobacillaceae bacterium]